MDRVEDCISFLIGKAGQQITRRAREKLGAYGVTPAQYAVLKVLWERDGLSGAELGGRLLIDSATITGLADRLQAAGLLERRCSLMAGSRVKPFVQLSCRCERLVVPVGSWFSPRSACAAA